MPESTEPETATLEAELAQIRGGVAMLPGTRTAVLVEGPDAATYLQGQLSQDVAGLASGESAWSLILAPQGKVDVFVRATRTGDESFVLDTDAGFEDRLVARLQRFLLRTKAIVTALPWSSLALRGPEAVSLAGSLSSGSDLVVAPVQWGTVNGVDLVGSADALNTALPADARPPVMSCEAFDLLRIEAGEPLMGAELDEATIPAAAGVVERSVSFTKGCYTGQELVARMDSRGSNVPRRMVGLEIAGEPVERAMLADVELFASDDAELVKSVGAVTSAQWSPERNATVALAYVGRAVTDGSVLQVRTPAGVVSAQMTTLSTDG